MFSAARAQARAAGGARRAAYLKDQRDKAKKLLAADKVFLEEGDAKTAHMIYTRIAVSRPKSEVTIAAQQRIVALPQLAAQRFTELKAQLPNQAIATTSDVLAAIKRDREWSRPVLLVFEQLAILQDQCEGIAKLENACNKSIADLQTVPAFAVVLQQSEAEELLKRGEQHEKNGEVCCAYLAYEEASELLPSPAGQIARDHFSALSKDAQVVASAKMCTELAQCHSLYARAEKLDKIRPETARKYYADIVLRIPQDSKLYQAAREKLNDL